MRACLARVIRQNGPKIRIKRLQCRKLMDNDCFRSKSVCGSCWVVVATVAALSGEENAPDAVAGQVKSGEWRVESLREGGALRAQGRRKKEGGRRAVRPLRGRGV